MRWFLDQPFLRPLFPPGLCLLHCTALHFLPVFTATLAPDTFGSADWRNCSTCLEGKTLNSSMDFRWSFGLRQAMLLKLLGSPDRLLK